MVVLVLLMERIIENVRMEMNRKISEMDRPTQVISCNSNLFYCGRERMVTLLYENGLKLN